MKFLNNEDEKAFFREAQEQGISVDELFIKRGKILRRFKDFRKSQAGKQAWRHNRRSFMRGISRFARSSKGKRFHRQLGKFLSLRTPLFKGTLADISRQFQKIRNLGKVSTEQLLQEDMSRDFVTVNSLKNHLMLELTYCLPTKDATEIIALCEEGFPILDSIIGKISENTYDFEFDEILFLEDLCQYKSDWYKSCSLV